MLYIMIFFIILRIIIKNYQKDNYITVLIISG